MASKGASAYDEGFPASVCIVLRLKRSNEILNLELACMWFEDMEDKNDIRSSGVVGPLYADTVATSNARLVPTIALPLLLHNCLIKQV